MDVSPIFSIETTKALLQSPAL